MAEPTSDEVPLDRLLVAALRPVLGDVDVAELRRLTGGASRETWSFDATSSDGTVHALILRRDPPGRPGPAGSMGREARCIVAAGEAGLPVPRVLVHSDDVSVLGAAGIVMARVEGEAIARKILRDERFTRARRGLVASCGAALAGVHRLDPSVLGDGSPSAFGGEDDSAEDDSAEDDSADGGAAAGGAAVDVDAVDVMVEAPDPLEEMRGALDSLGRTTPVFEYALRWLEAHRPAPTAAPSLVHGDFRLGNLMVDDDGLVAVLDWELAHLGDPAEDLGWLCVRAWRFGQAAPVAGLGERQELLDAYHDAGGVHIDPEVLRWWEIYGNLRWGVICMVQTAVFLGGRIPSVELAAVGRRVAETEWDLLLLIAPDATTRALDASERGAAGGAEVDATALAEGDLHGRPTAAELLSAVSTFLRDDVMSSGQGRVAFHARVAANVVDLVAREIEQGDTQRRRRADALAVLQLEDETALAAAIRDGGLDPLELLVDGVLDRLRVANPRYL